MAASPSSMPLSPLDVIMPRCYTRLALYFRTDEPSQELLPKLQSSFDKTCHFIPWLAGKVLRTIDTTSQKPWLQIQWDESQSPPKLANLGSLPGSYVETALSGMPLTTIPTDKWPASAIIDEDVTYAGALVFVGGLVSFDGLDGIALCICLHHHVVDAGGLAEVVRIWAGITSGESPTTNTIAERLNRLSAALSSHLETASARPLKDLLASHPEYTTEPPNIGPEFPKCSSTVFTISHSKVNSLKTELLSCTSVVPTANTIISAMLWATVTRIRQRRNSTLFPSGKSRLGMAVNGRSRIAPNFSPPNDPYFGNANLYALCELEADALSSSVNSTKALAHICDAIAASHSADMIGPRHIAEVCSLVSRLDNFAALFPGWSVYNGPDIAVTSWANLGIYDLSFGDVLGNPEFVRVPYAEADSLAIVLPRKRVGSEGKVEEVIEVVVMLRSEDLEALRTDKGWKSVAA